MDNNLNNPGVAINISKKVKNEIVPKIDERKFLRLGYPETARLTLFNFALALGVKLDKRTPFIGGDSFARTETFQPKDWAWYDAIYFTKVINEDKNRIDELCDRRAVLKVVEEYANTGFLKLEELMQEDEETLTLRILSELKGLYKSAIYPESLS